MMSMLTQRTPLLALLMGAVLMTSAPACLDAPEYFYGYDLRDTRLVVYDADMGVHPNTSVLDDPNNPFRFQPAGDAMRFTLLNYANSSAAFYAWATALAQGGNGERQFYTALLAQRIYENQELSDVELPSVYDIAVNGFTAVLESFPDSVSYDATGQYPFRLAPGAYNAIIELGALPPQGWEVVDGVVLRVPNDAENAPAPEEEESP
jgi:hypothetical protein